VHDKFRRFKCLVPDCGKAFTRRLGLSKHIEKAHKLSDPDSKQILRQAVENAREALRPGSTPQFNPDKAGARAGGGGAGTGTGIAKAAALAAMAASGGSRNLPTGSAVASAPMPGSGAGTGSRGLGGPANAAAVAAAAAVARVSGQLAPVPVGVVRPGALAAQMAGRIDIMGGGQGTMGGGSGRAGTAIAAFAPAVRSGNSNSLGLGSTETTLPTGADTGVASDFSASPKPGNGGRKGATAALAAAAAAAAAASKQQAAAALGTPNAGGK